MTSVVPGGVEVSNSIPGQSECWKINFSFLIKVYWIMLTTPVNVYECQNSLRQTNSVGISLCGIYLSSLVKYYVWNMKIAIGTILHLDSIAGEK